MPSLGPNGYSGPVDAQRSIIDLQHLSSSNYYPILIEGGQFDHANEVEFCRGYAEPYSSSAPGLAYVNLKFRFYGYSWGGSHVGLYVDFFQENYRNTVGLVGYRGYYNPVIFARGGYRYNYRTNFISSWIIVESPTLVRNAGDQYDYGLGPISEATVAGMGNYMGGRTTYGATYSMSYHLSGVGY